MDGWPNYFASNCTCSSVPGDKGDIEFLDLWFFAVGFFFLYKFVQFVRLAMFIAKMDVVQISTYQFVQKGSRRQWEHQRSHDGMGWRNRTADNNATTNQRTAERRQRQRRWRQLGGKAAATAGLWRRTAQWRQGGGSSAEATAAAAARRWRTARRRQGMDGATARATAINGAGQEDGATRERREALRQPAGLEVPPWFNFFLVTRIYVN